MTTRRRTGPLAALLLALQLAGGGLIALAHAREAPTAPSTIEAAHDARCVVVHNAIHCASCQLSTARPAAGAMRLPPWGAATLRHGRMPPHPIHPAADARRSAPPRAPPPLPR